jgi:hypothetical protein
MQHNDRVNCTHNTPTESTMAGHEQAAAANKAQLWRIRLALTEGFAATYGVSDLGEVKPLVVRTRQNDAGKLLELLRGHFVTPTVSRLRDPLTFYDSEGYSVQLDEVLQDPSSFSSLQDPGLVELTFKAAGVDRVSVGGSAAVASSSGAPQSTPTALVNSGAPQVSPLVQSRQPSDSRGTDKVGQVSVEIGVRTGGRRRQPQATAANMFSNFDAADARPHPRHLLS